MNKQDLIKIEKIASHIVNNAIIAQQQNEDTQDTAETELRGWFNELKELFNPTP